MARAPAEREVRHIRKPPAPRDWWQEPRSNKVRRLRNLRATLRTLYGEYRALRRELVA